MSKEITLNEDFKKLVSEETLDYVLDRHQEIINLKDVSGVSYLNMGDYIIVEWLDLNGEVIFRLHVDVKKSVGRPSKGITKKVSLTLPGDVWNYIDRFIELGLKDSKSEYFRDLILNDYKDNNMLS